MTGRRRSQRYSIQLAAQVSFSCEDAEEARLCDLSSGGGMVIGPLRSEFGAEIRVRFVLAPDVVCESRGRVLRTVKHDEEHAIAFEFAQMNAAFEHFLQNLEGASTIERDRFLADVTALTIEIVT